MTKFYCDYCDTFLTHDSPSVRKTHNSGRKHKENVRMFYQKWMEAQAQKLVDATASAFTRAKALAATGMPSGMPSSPYPMGGMRMGPPMGMHPGMGRGMPPFPGGPPMGGMPPYMMNRGPPPMGPPPMGPPGGFRPPMGAPPMPM